jgi:prepilin signal peptidase PulO-like enzyme (type II secretory pathway)
VGPPVNDAYILVTAFVAHALLFSLMTAASLVDVDEKTIPDGVTVPGTLLAFVLAAVAPNSLLPHVSMQNNPSIISTQLLFTPSDEQVLAGFMPYLEPLTLTAPGEWPPALQGLPHWQGLAIGVGCYLLWIVAIAPGEMRLGRGFGTGLRLVAARKCRALAMRPLAPLALIGAAVIAAVWALGGAAWAALLSALVGALGGGALVWSVRIVATAAMRREAMGFGDVTLMMMIGAFVGWQTTLLIFFLAPFAALVVGIIQLIVRRDDVIPYGPFLCLAAAAVVVAWAYLWNAEQRVQHIFEMPGLVVAAIAGGVLLLGCVLAIWVRIKEAMFGRRYDEA